MKVEVDADELCKLKEAASSRGPLCFADLASLVNERDELLNQVGEMEDINSRLRSEIDAVESERDWWREHAIKAVDGYAYLYTKSGISVNGAAGNLRDKAASKGYEVPE